MADGRTRAAKGAVVVLAAAVSLALIPAAPGYDPWSWLLWGRQVAHGWLSTADGPAFKPLPVGVCALLAPLGGAAPWAWVALVRAGAAAGCWLVFRAGRRLGGPAAGVLAALAVGLAAGFPLQAATGGEAPLVIAFALAAAEAWRAGRLRAALLCGAACALLRVEAWPFLAAAGVAAWRREPGMRALVAALAVLVPAAWLLPEWLGSGDPLRSGARARVPMPGQPALDPVPAWASLEAAAGLVLWPLWAGAAVAAVRLPAARPLVGAGAGWVALVALMAQAGFSGEPRYLLPGVALLGVAGAAGLATLPVRGRAPVVAAVALAAAFRVADLPALRTAQVHQAALARDLPAAVAAAGGRAAVLSCGTPYVGPLRGPLMAYELGVARRAVQPDAPPRPPGVVFRTRLTPAQPPAPAAAPPFRDVARVGPWHVLASCS